MLENNMDIVLASGPFKGLAVDQISSIINIAAVCIGVAFFILIFLTLRIVRKTTNERKDIKGTLKRIKIVMFCIYVPLGVFNMIIYNLPVNIVHNNNIIETNIKNYNEAQKKMLEIINDKNARGVVEDDK